MFQRTTDRLGRSLERIGKTGRLLDQGYGNRVRALVANVAVPPDQLNAVRSALRTVTTSLSQDHSLRLVVLEQWWLLTQDEGAGRAVLVLQRLALHLEARLEVLDRTDPDEASR